MVRIEMCLDTNSKSVVGFCTYGPVITLRNLKSLNVSCIKQTAASHSNLFSMRNNFFSFDCSNMQIFSVYITRVVWPHVTNVLDLWYFCEHNPLFYHLNLIPCHYWSWQRNIYFLVNIFVRHIFPMLKSSIKTKTVLTMTNMTESTELQAFTFYSYLVNLWFYQLFRWSH